MSEPAAIGDMTRRLMAKIERVQAASANMPATAEEPDDTGDLERWQEMEWARVIPPRLRGARLDSVDGSPGRMLAEWASSSAPKPNVIITGPVGVGKTWASIAAVRPAFESSMSVAFYSVGQALRDLTPGAPYQHETMDALLNVQRLVLDDVGTERTSEWAAEQVHAVIDDRWLNQRPVIATTNFAIRELRERLGPRVASRLLDDAVVIAMAGRDRRLHP